MRAWLGVVARRRSNELFVLNVLLVILLMAFLTGLAGLSMVLGAFLAGMLISETEYRFQVEEDIKPFRDVLLGLFFVTVGMLLDLSLVLADFARVLLFFLALLAGKFALIALLARAFGAATGTALRVGLALAQAGEFGFVLLALAAASGIAREEVLQALLAAMILSMIATPFLIQASDAIVMRVSSAEWMLRAHVHELNPKVPVVARARDEADIERLMAAGASEVVPEALESGVMLASHTLVWLGVPLSRVMRRVAQVREEHYELLKGLFHGVSDAKGENPGRLHSVTPDEQGDARGSAIAELNLDGVPVPADGRP